MLGLWLQHGTLGLRGDIPDPVPGPDEALVQPLLAGICSTDHQLLDGLYGFVGIPGHELVALVESGPTELIGRRVVAEINCPCGHCARCRRGLGKHCANRQVIGIRGRNGAFAERLAVPIANLHPVPEGIPSRQAVFAEPLAAALDVREQIRPGPDDRVLILGDGKLGQLVVHALRPTGCRLSVLGRHLSKLAPLAGLGIETLTDAAGIPPDFDCVVECTGSPAGFAVARRAVRPGGFLVLKSTYGARVEVDLSAVAVDEIRIFGSRCGPFDQALALLDSGALDLGYLIDSVYPLEEALDAFARSRQSGVLKVLIGGAV